jgi:3-deoxy-D-manno-octulosonic-acid transferase
VPLFLVNVRLSSESLRGYLRVPRTAKEMLERATVICAQTSSDAQRLKSLGVSRPRLEVTGNLKFDSPLPAELLGEAKELRNQWGADRPVWIAASTHRGEERKILSAYKTLREVFSDLLLVVVPRHPERFTTVARLCRRSGARVALRSIQHADIPEDVDILVGDTMGELQRLYAASDISFVGGSLARVGGHNLLESCAVGVPVVFGPHMFHFEEISVMALERGAGRQVQDEDELAEIVAFYLQQVQVREAAGQAGRALVAENRGAVDRTLQLIADSPRWGELKQGKSNIISAIND